MSPGSIVQLIASYEPAFRVTFIGARPPPQELYWRGPVLHEFDGYTWRRTSGESALRGPLEYLGSAVPLPRGARAEPSALVVRRSTRPRAPPMRAWLLTYDRELIAR